MVRDAFKTLAWLVLVSGLVGPGAGGAWPRGPADVPGPTVTEGPGAKVPKASESVLISDLAVTVEPTADLFPLKEPLSFAIKFTNTGKQAVAVQVTTWFNETLGTYTYSIRNPDTKKTWSVVPVPLPKGFLGPPVGLATKQIPPGQTLSTRVSFPIFGLGLRSETGEVSFLPAGTYELTITLDLKQGKATTKPVTFRVSDQEKSVLLLKGLPKDKIAKIAQDYFAQRLEVYKKNNKGKPWDTLTVDSFTSTIVAGPEHWLVTYTADLKEMKQRLTMQISLDAAGKVQSVNPGFVLSSTEPPPVPPVIPMLGSP
jgi:hypothetical protein